MPPILHDEIENNRTLLLTNMIGPKLKMCICAFSFKSFSPFHIPRATFVNLLYDEITIFLDNLNSWFEDSWKLLRLNIIWRLWDQFTVESRVLTRVTNSKIKFLPKGHSTNTSKIAFIDNLKRPACASKRNVLELVTLQYLHTSSF